MGQRPSSWVVVAALSILLLSACSSEDPVVSRARSVFDESRASSPDHATYGLAIALASGTSFGHQTALEAVASTDYTTALEALRALAEKPDAQVEPVLREAYETKKAAAHRLQAAVGLARLGDAAALGWIGEQVDGGALNSAALSVLAEHGEEERVVMLLGKMMDSEESSIRNNAYALLGDLRYPWATELLLAGLKKEFGEERIQAIVSLGRTGDPAVAETLQKFVTFQGLVFASIEALGALGNPGSIPAIESMADHEKELVRVYAAVALWRLGEEERGTALVDGLIASEDPLVRENLAVQLGAVESAGAQQRLATLSGDTVEAVRLEALRSLGSQPSAPADTLASRIEDPSYQVATVALDGLARLGSIEQVAGLEPLLDNPNPYIALSAANAILCIKERNPSGS
jgi:HEAT repeat protein